MTLDELKLAAKRLRKQGAELFGAAYTPLTQVQALELAARLHGFRDYHEAQQRLIQRAVLEDLLCEPGGLLSTQQIAHNMANLILAAQGVVHVAGASGIGKSAICSELVVQALAKGRPVRILDSSGTYRRLTHFLQGQYFRGASDAAHAAWTSALNLVTLDARQFDFELLRPMPPGTLLVCDEVERYRDCYRPLESRMCLLVGQHVTAFPEEARHRIVNVESKALGLYWHWQTGNDCTEFRLYAGPLRFAAYTTQADYLRALGNDYDPRRMRAFVGTLKMSS